MFGVLIIWDLSDVGRNPRGRSFMFGVDPMGEHEERVEEHDGNHEGETRETLNRHEFDHTSARSSRHKVTRDPKSTRDNTKEAVLLREEVLIAFSGWRS